MEADQKDVISKQHESGEFISDSALSECIVPEIAYYPEISSGFPRSAAGLDMAGKCAYRYP